MVSTDDDFIVDAAIRCEERLNETGRLGNRAIQSMRAELRVEASLILWRVRSRQICPTLPLRR